ncbi:hypothetical protein RB195_007187 [Necator americanus]|uniref:Uncharacterized protein n=1 Tax=Necator americanus TaxID=51031 RepID=A0ABR1BZW3_NECAM
MNGKAGTALLLLPVISILHFVKTLPKKETFVIGTRNPARDISFEEEGHGRLEMVMDDEAIKASKAANPCQTVRERAIPQFVPIARKGCLVVSREGPEEHHYHFLEDLLKRSDQRVGRISAVRLTSRGIQPLAALVL